MASHIQIPTNSCIYLQWAPQKQSSAMEKAVGVSRYNRSSNISGRYSVPRDTAQRCCWINHSTPPNNHQFIRNQWVASWCEIILHTRDKILAVYIQSACSKPGGWALAPAVHTQNKQGGRPFLFWAMNLQLENPQQAQCQVQGKSISFKHRGRSSAWLCTPCVSFVVLILRFRPGFCFHLEAQHHQVWDCCYSGETGHKFPIYRKREGKKNKNKKQISTSLQKKNAYRRRWLLQSSFELTEELSLWKALGAERYSA